MVKSPTINTLAALYLSGTLIVSYINEILTIYIEKQFIESIFGPHAMYGKISSSVSETKGSFRKQPVELLLPEVLQGFSALLWDSGSAMTDLNGFNASAIVLFWRDSVLGSYIQLVGPKSFVILC